MIFQRATRREFTQAAAGVFVALFAILLTTQLIRLLGDAAQGEIAPEAVVALLGFSSLHFTSTLLSLSAFVAILLSLSRSYRDSEMVVWFASGQSLLAWVRPVMVFVFPLLLAITALALFVSPWALSQSAEYRGNLESRRDAGQATPGMFQESSSGELVIFVEAAAEDASEVRNVFVSSMRNQRLGVTMAATGHQEFAPNGDRFIVLENGRRYEVDPGSPEFRILEYERYAIRVETKEARGIEKSPKNSPTLELIANDQPRYRAELMWGLSIPLSTIGDAFGVLPEGHNLSAKEWKQLSSQWREELDRRIHTLTALRDQLDGCIGCGCLSRRDCPLRNPGDKLGEEGTGARLLEDDV